MTRTRRLVASVCALMVVAAAATVPGLGGSWTASAASPWDQLGLDVDGVAAGDQSGYSVALSDDGTRLAVGAVRDDGTHAGSTRVFQWSGSGWVRMGADIAAESIADESGYSVALSADGTRLAVGARLNNAAAPLAGHVRVFRWSGAEWIKMGADIDGESRYEQAGYAVALSDDGTRLAVGAPGGDGNRGLVRVYGWSGTEWSQLGDTITGDAPSDTSGWSVALSAGGTRLAVGAPGSDASAANAGRVTVFDWTGSTWTRLGSVDGEAANDFAGRSIALSADGSRLAVGAAKNDGAGVDAGHTRVYSWSGSTWLPMGPDVDGDAANDQSGAAVALSADGSRLAVGAPGPGPGHVRVFVWSGSFWVPSGERIVGEADDDRSGSSLALSAGGTAVAIGAPRNDGAGTNAGSVRIHGSLIPTPVPGPPSGVTGTIGDSQVTVSWSAPLSSGGSPVTGYTVTAAPGGATCTTSGALSCTVTGLTNGTGYTFAVTATNGDGTGPAAAPPSWLTPATLPGAPTGVTARRTGDAAAIVWWSAPESDGGSTITTYTATASPGDATCETAGALSCTITGLSDDSTHTFTVTATNGVGTGAASAASAPVVATAPDAPTGALAIAGNTAATVTWTPPAADGGSTITTYTVTASPGGATCATAVLVSCTVTGLTNDIAHTFTVAATNAIGTGPPSAPTNIGVPTAPPIETSAPGAPTDVIAVAGDTTATVSWTPPAADGGSPITVYIVTASPGDATCATALLVSCTVAGLTNGVAHTFTVTATNAIGTGLPSAPSDPVTPAAAATAPVAPTGVTAVAGDTTASVWWSAPATDGGSAITAYTATAAPGGANCTTGGALSCTVTGLTNDIAHTFTVTATNAIGSSPPSSPSPAVTPEGPPGEVTSLVPGTPTGVAAVAGDREATVSWVAPAAGSGARVTGYTATAWPGGTTCSTTTATTCTVSGLSNGVTYSISVVASAAGITGLPSPAVSVTPDAGAPGGGGSGPGTVVSSPSALSPCPSPPLPFTDTATVIAPADVACIFGLGITTGTSATTYGPDGIVDRNQMASFLARLWRAADQDCPSPTLPFTDIDDVISRADIACIYGLGITTGTSPTTYGPHGLVDRNQMASFLARLWRAADQDCPSPTLPFTDIDDVISRADIACIYGLGITTGTSPTTYRPDGLGGLVDRDQMASFLARLWRSLAEA